MTDEEHARRMAMQERLEKASDAWRARGNQPQHDEDARLGTDDAAKEMASAKAEVLHILEDSLGNAEERMTAAAIATRGRPIDSRELADTMAREMNTRRASTYAAAAALSGMGR